MKRLLPLCGSLVPLILVAPAAAQAHSFATPYVLPVPFWLYVYGCVATLIVTFALLALFVAAPATPGLEAQLQPRAGKLLCVLRRRTLWLLQAGAVGCLLLTILSGLIGTTNPEDNIGMSLFWVLFLLGFAYVTVFIGNLYAVINPWRLITSGLERAEVNPGTSGLGSTWPALSLYLGLIWIELFVAPRPLTLSIALIIYIVINLVGVALFGGQAWYCRGEVFGVLFRLIGKLSPVEYVARDRTSWEVRLRPPLTGALHDAPQHMSLVILVLLILSSTTYDAIRETTWWIGLFWKNALWILQPLWGTDLGRAQTLLMDWYLLYQRAGLVMLLGLYLGLYLMALSLVRALARAQVSLRTLALTFSYTLLPIAVAYGFTHYFTLIIVQGRSLPRLLSDPFGFGWNLLGITATSDISQLNMPVIWHVQVAVLVGGHMVSAYLAHAVALRTFGNKRTAVTSQLPLLGLMVVYTVFGLWILSLPLGTE